jgi:hypothetical protein
MTKSMSGLQQDERAEATAFTAIVRASHDAVIAKKKEVMLPGALRQRHVPLTVLHSCRIRRLG